MNHTKITLETLFLTVFIFSCCAMQQTNVQKKVPPVCLKIKYLKKNSPKQDYLKLVREIIDNNESVCSCITQYRKAKRAKKVAALQKSPVCPISPEQWKEKIDKPAREYFVQLQQPNLSTDQLITNINCLPEELNYIATIYKLKIPLEVMWGNEGRSSISCFKNKGVCTLNLNSAKRKAYLHIFHEFEHLIQMDVSYCRYIESFFKECSDNKKAAGIVDVENDSNKHRELKTSLERSQEKIADQIPCACNSLMVAKDIQYSTYFYLKKEFKRNLSRGYYENKKAHEKYSTHPPWQKRMDWINKIVYLKKVEEREKNKLINLQN